MVSKVLYVTSFNEKLYRASGERLIKSFSLLSSEADLLVCYEGGSYHEDFKELTWLKLYNLDGDPFLKRWLSENKDVIPLDRGGQFDGCRCKYRKGIEKIFPFLAKKIKRDGHVECCPDSFWNKRASGWFRKIVSIDYALKKFSSSYDYIVWIDCDCVFLKTISKNFLISLFLDKEIIFLKGERAVAETGWLGLKVGDLSRNIFEQIRDVYESKEFRSFERWDDAFIIGSVLLRPENYSFSRDIASKKSYFNGTDSNVFPCSLVGEYVEHWKGNHSRVLKIEN